MSLKLKLSLLNKLSLPKDIIEYIKYFTFHEIKKILENDDRYYMLENMQQKEYYEGKTFLYLTIDDEKDYYIVYDDNTLYIQVLRYDELTHIIHLVDVNKYLIK
jgi:hypothetical protein